MGAPRHGGSEGGSGTALEERTAAPPVSVMCLLRCGALKCSPASWLARSKALRDSANAALKGGPGFSARPLQPVQSSFGVPPHLRCLLDGGVDVSASRNSEIRCVLLQLVGCVSPSFDLRRRNVPKGCLLMLDLLADSLEIRLNRNLPLGSV